MRVLLVAPTHNYKFQYPSFLSNTDFPVGFAYLASALRRAGHDVFGLNPNNMPGYASAHEMLQSKLSGAIKEHQPQVIGVGGLCTDFAFLKDAIQIIRTTVPDVPIVCGGGIINNDAPFAFETLRPDFCVIGEGEEVLVQLTDMLASGRRDYDTIPNLGYWKGTAPQFTRQDFRYGDLDSRPFPDYEPFGINDMLDHYGLAARYLYRYTRTDPRPMTLVTARSCPFRCTFCVHQRGPKYRARSIENIIQEITVMYDRYHFNILIILDELFAVNRRRLREFCAALMERRKALGWDFDWFFQTHASASLQTEDMKMAREAGCYCFSYGLESASPSVLASMNKRTKLPQIVEAIERAHAAKIGFGGNFIFGDSAETTTTVAETMEFLTKHLLDDHIYFDSIQPYPGSQLFDSCLQNKIIRDKLDFYEHIHQQWYNTSAVSDEVWYPWLAKLNGVAWTFPWVRSVNAFSSAEEPEAARNTFAAYTGQKLYEVQARCPHCDGEARYRELLREQDGNPSISEGQKPSGRLFERAARLLSKIATVYCREHKHLLKYFKNKISIILERQRVVSLLDRIKGRGTIAALSFITGCPHCNKRFRINITNPPATLSRSP